MDIDSIALGEDFVKAVETTVAKCDVLIAVIGNNWLTSKNDRGDRRLDNAEDFVRMEIAAALKREISVIPVLVDGASMPNATDLPEDLKPLVRRNALKITDTGFDSDCQRLAARISTVLEKAAAVKQERPIAMSTRPAQPEADKPSAEIPNLLHPLPPKLSEPKDVKPLPPLSGGTASKSSSKQVIPFLAIPTALVVAGIIYLAIRAPQSSPPQPVQIAAVTPSLATIPTPLSTAISSPTNSTPQPAAPSPKINPGTTEKRATPAQTPQRSTPEQTPVKPMPEPTPSPPQQPPEAKHIDYFFSILPPQPGRVRR